jgi:hypothetical protein
MVLVVAVPDNATVSVLTRLGARPLTTWRGPNLRARTGSLNGLTAIDVEDMAGDE